ncbi:MAG: aminoacyl-histidine dipeptidase [Bacteroidales bacterium]|nr:aminoacyl-histidine dipeptidase [Bacteroidales bacterium]
MELSDSHPIWKHFNNICKVPRPSGKEEKIIEFLINFSKENKLAYSLDEVGNLLIKKPASPGKENVQTVILQSHVDMVCEKNMGTKHNFESDPILPVVDGNWIKASGTTLGADDGIGVASQMAILEASDLEHGPIECLFTIDEESGMTGAKGLNKDFLKGKILLNLDSEDEGELYIGCAGGLDTVITFQYLKEKTPENNQAFKVSIEGLKGGHSGDEINKGIGNSIKILNRYLSLIDLKFQIRLHSFNGGNLRNAIPREAQAIFMLDRKFEDSLIQFTNQYSKTVTDELSVKDPNFSLKIEKTKLPEFVLPVETQLKLISSLYACPHGAFTMSSEIPGLVETSTNLASIKFIPGNQIKVVTSQRSSRDSSKEDIAQMVASVFKLAGARVKHSGDYPGWVPNQNSEILSITSAAYKDLFHVEPQVKAIHAGLECGLFLEKYPDWDMISIGPTIRGAHSPDEKLDIESTYKFWKLLVEVLERIQ